MPRQEFISQSFTQRLKSAGALFAVAACFFTPLSTSLLGIFSILAALTWLLSASFLTLLDDFRQHPSLLCSFLLFLLMSIAIVYSPANTITAFDTLKKYRELFLLPVIFSLLSGRFRYADLAEKAFLGGCIVLMLVSYGMAGGIIPEERYGHSFVFHITHSFFMAILSFWSLTKAVETRKFQIAWMTVFIAATINLFYLAPGRTGMLIFICLMVLFLLQRLSPFKCLAGVLVLSAATLTIYMTSSNFSGRLQEVVSEIRQYTPGKSRTSIGQRFDWWMTTMTLIEQKPLLGHGTGSFAIMHQKATENLAVTPTDNPHNEFLFLTVQFGVVGLSLFLAVLLCLMFEGRLLTKSRNYLLQGVICAMLSGSLMNSLLFDSQQGHFFLFMSAALLAGPTRENLLLP